MSGVVGNWIEFGAGRFTVTDPVGGASTGRGGSGTVYLIAPDGTYAYSAHMDIVLTGSTVAIHEEGTYEVQGDRITFHPTRKRYVRDGVDEPDTPMPRAFRWRVETNPYTGAPNMTLAGDGFQSTYVPA